MNEEINQEQEVEVQPVEQSVEETPSVNEIEPRRSGHMSQDEWIAAGRDPNEWKDEKAFKEAGNYIDQIKGLKKELYEQQAAVKALSHMYHKDLIAKRDAKKAFIQDSIKKATEMGDTHAVQYHMDEKYKMEMEELKNPQQYIDPDQLVLNTFLDANQDLFPKNNPHLFEYNKNMGWTIQQRLQAEYAANGMDPNIYGREILDKVAEELRQKSIVSKPTMPTFQGSTSNVNKSVAQSSNGAGIVAKMTREQKSEYAAVKASMDRLKIPYSEKDYLAQIDHYGDA